MSATLVSSNTTLKVNAGISAGNSFGQSSGTLYTAPANGYAIVHLSKLGTFGAVLFTIGGKNATTAATAAFASNSYPALYVGPSQSVSWSGGSSEGANTVNVNGVEFVNTP